MSYQGDIAEDATIIFSFNTVDADGDPITFAGPPTFTCYKDGNLVQDATGITSSIDHDSVTGFHKITVDSSSAAFYATGSDYSVVVVSGTVDTKSMAGIVVGEFSIENRYMRGTNSAALASDYTSARAGYLDNINGHTAQTGDTFAQLPSLFSNLSINTAGEVTVGANNDKTGYTASTVTDKTGYSISGSITTLDGLNDPTAATIADSVWDEARSAHTTAGTFGEGLASVQGNVTGSVGSVAGNVDGSVGSVAGNVTGSVGSVAGNVDGSVGSVAGNVDGSVGSVAGNVDGSVGSVASSGLDTVLDQAAAIDTGLTIRQCLRYCAAALFGQVSGAASTTITIRNGGTDTANRIVASVDADGNRTSVTLS